VMPKRVGRKSRSRLRMYVAMARQSYTIRR
jgi:hypothetical protein